jgi:transposase-like protein
VGRPPSGVDEYLDWQQRLQNQKESGLSIEVFCLQEGVSKSTYYRWVEQLKNGVPESLKAEDAAREQVESGEAKFLPISLKASPVEIELPNGAVVRLPLGVGQAVLVEVVRAAGAFRPWKAPTS